MNKPKNKVKVKSVANQKRMRLSGGMAQIMVVLNGLLLSVTAFFLMVLFVQGMTRDEYKRSSDAAGTVFAEKIIKLENAMRVVSGIMLLSDNPYRETMPEQIRRNVSGLSAFDQVLWLFEIRPGKWQYRMIFEKSTQDFQNDDYKMMPNQALIQKLVDGNYFASDSLRAVSDFPGMVFGLDKGNPNSSHIPFALIKVIERNNTKRGILIGVSRPGFFLDQGLISGSGAIGRLMIRDRTANSRLYTLDNTKSSGRNPDYTQDYKFFVGENEWNIVTEFIKKDNVILLEAVPYIVLFFGGMLTLVGALFVRNNQRQSRRLADVNASLEVKNFELENEVAERERLNRALEKTSRDNRAIIDSVSDVIFETDTDGKILFLSAAWRKITGFNPEHSKDHTLFSMLHPEEQEKQRQDFDLMVAGQKQAYRNFSRIRSADGTFRAIEIAISMIRQDENKNLRVVGTVTDVEERRRAERALAEAEKKYRAIVENAAGGLFQLTPEGMYLNANPAMARILGYDSIEEMMRTVKNANGIIYPDIQERNRFMIDLTTVGQIFGHEIRVRKKDGSLIWISENVRVVRDDQQNILYFEGSMEDITKRKEADLALLEAKIQSDIASRTKTEFIANMSHELRTPLNAIIGFSDIMKDQLMGPLGASVYVDYANDINKSGQGLLKIINEILDLAKIESGTRELKEREFKLSKTVDACLEVHGAKLKDKKIVLHNKATEFPVILGEETAIKQVIGNIYANAIKYTQQGGRITLFSDYNADGSFRFTIADDGIGMTHREVETAMSAFGQVENRHDRSGSGTGLGLPLSKALIELHGGQIDITSEKGLGTSVSVIFPAERVIEANKTNKNKAPVT